jgi:hypothetical protein
MKISRRLNVDEVAKNLPLLLNELTRKNEGVFVEKDGRLYRLEPVEINTADPEDLWVNYDPVKAKAALHASVGALAHVDVETLLSDLREQRKQDSTGRPAD